MSDIPHFEEAVAQFRRFLADRGYPEEVCWVFREDLWQLSSTRVLVKYPPPSETHLLAQKVFTDGRRRGLIEVKAVAAAADKVAAIIWFPKYPDEEVQGWDRGMKLGISQPLPRAELVGAWRWGLLSLLPRFRHYQKAATFIGTRAWAAAQQLI